MHDEPESIKIISKTQLKKEATALQELGRELTDFKADDLDKLELSTRLRAAIDEFKKLPNAHGAKKRHLQYIGRLMRESDGEDLKRKIRHLDTSPQISPKEKFENEISNLKKDLDKPFEVMSVTEYPTKDLRVHLRGDYLSLIHI